MYSLTCLRRLSFGIIFIEDRWIQLLILPIFFYYLCLRCFIICPSGDEERNGRRCYSIRMNYCALLLVVVVSVALSVSLSLSPGVPELDMRGLYMRFEFFFFFPANPKRFSFSSSSQTVGNFLDDDVSRPGNSS